MARPLATWPNNACPLLYYLFLCPLLSTVLDKTNSPGIPANLTFRCFPEAEVSPAFQLPHTPSHPSYSFCVPLPLATEGMNISVTSFHKMLDTGELGQL